MRRMTAILAVLVVLLLTMARPGFAEWFADLYLGAAITEKSDIDVSVLGTTVPVEADWDDSVTVGGRLGYWFGNPGWIGLALDASFFKPADDTTIVPISALLMLRAPLMKGSEFPHGRLQPYIGAGPSVFISSVDDDVEGVGNVSDTSVDVGFDARGGLAFLLTRNVAIFGEYRFTHVSPEFSFDILGFRTKAETTFDTHHLFAGVSFRF
jgi:opacity protein-like surface antigen